jgi:hypothetical protein
MKKWFRWACGVALAGAAALQLTNPPLTNPPVVPGHDLLAAHPPPPRIAAMLKAACYNCHSYETKWPWYSHVAPFSWRLVAHVTDAREAMNFSEWPHDEPSRTRKRWRHIAEEVESRDMPIAAYAMMHPSARLSDQQRAELVQWAKAAGQ